MNGGGGVWYDVGMGLPATKKLVTAEEYLEAEHLARDRHEYDYGEVLMMAGCTDEHETIFGNVFGELRDRLKGTPCAAKSSNMRVAIRPGGRYVYPDISVVCGRSEFDPVDKRHTTITNPRVIVEVLSPSTERYDRGKKLADYLSMETVEEYVLVSQSEPRIDVFSREPGRPWAFAIHRGPEAVARLHSLKIDLPLSEVYGGVEFRPEEGDPRTDTNE